MSFPPCSVLGIFSNHIIRHGQAKDKDTDKKNDKNQDKDGGKDAASVIRTVDLDLFH